MPTQMSAEYNAAYLEGQTAFANGLACDDNPYGNILGDRFQGWTDGWCDANTEYNVSQNL